MIKFIRGNSDIIKYALFGAFIGLIICNLMFYYSFECVNDLYNEQVIENKQLSVDNTNLKSSINSLKDEITQLKTINAKWIEVSMCSKDTGFKSYMDYRSITNKASNQYRLIQQSNVDNGLLFVGNYICVALGSYYGEIGSIYRITLENGNVFEVIKTEEKSNSHTVNGCYIASNGNMVEFIIDTYSMDQNVLVHGDVSYLEVFKGSIVKMERLKG